MTENKYVTINLSPEMFAVLTGLTGLAIAVMQNDPEVAQGFATMLSDPEMEPVAKAETIPPKIRIVS